MVTTDCILIKRDIVDSNNGTLAAAGSYLDQGDVRLNTAKPTVDYEDQCCLHPLVSVIFFLAYVFLAAMIMINLVVGAILDNMASSSSEVLLPVTKIHIEDFVRVWAELDPMSTGATLNACCLAAHVLHLC